MSKRKAMAVKFKGQPGEFIGGIPARDLTAEEFARLSETLRARALASGLYQVESESADLDEQQPEQEPEQDQQE
jgi:hypothetical protein